MEHARRREHPGHGRAVPSASAVRRHDAQHRHLRAVRSAARRSASPACASTSAASRTAKARTPRAATNPSTCATAAARSRRYSARPSGRPRRTGAMKTRPSYWSVGRSAPTWRWRRRRPHHRVGRDRATVAVPARRTPTTRSAPTRGRSCSCSRRNDEFRTPDEIAAETHGWAATQIEVVAGASHFFVGRTERVVTLVADFVGARAG